MSSKTRTEHFASVNEYDEQFLREWLSRYAAPEETQLIYEDAWR